MTFDVRAVAYDNPSGFGHTAAKGAAAIRAQAAVTSFDLAAWEDLLYQFAWNDKGAGINGYHVREIVNQPELYPYTIPRFAWWLIANGHLNERPTPTEPRKESRD